MVDAHVLCTTDTQGNVLWHPRGLSDFLALPARTWELWVAIQNGIAARQQPWSWWRVKGMPTSHRFEASPLGLHDVARCGWRGPDGAEWLRDENPPLCQVCGSLMEQEARPRAGWGRIGDHAVGTEVG